MEISFFVHYSTITKAPKRINNIVSYLKNVNIAVCQIQVYMKRDISLMLQFIIFFFHLHIFKCAEYQGDY